MAAFGSDLDFVLPPEPAPSARTTAPARSAGFTDYPGPVIRIGAAGDLSAGNEIAAPFLACSSADQLSEMTQAARALQRRESVPECQLTAMDALRQKVVYAFTLVPLPSSRGALAFGREISDEVGQQIGRASCRDRV